MIGRRHAPLLLALVTIPVAACSMSWGDDDQGVAPQGNGGQRTYPVTGFEAVALGSAGDVEVRVGPDYSVTAIGTPAALDKILVERDGKSLKLTRRKGVNWSRGEKIRFLVTMPRITGADIGGSGTITIDRVPGGSFEGNIGGSGTLDVRGLAVDKVAFAIGGSGDVAAAGTARALQVSIGGSGTVRAQPLRVETGEITIAGAGNIQANITRSAEVTIMGSGDVDITGGAKCSVTKMGGGKVNCG